MPRKKKPTLAAQLQQDLADCSGLHSASTTPAPPNDQLLLDCAGFHSTSLTIPMRLTTVINVPACVSNPIITWVTPPPSTSLTPAQPDDRPCWKCWGPARQCICDPEQWNLPPHRHSFNVCPRCAASVPYYQAIHPHRELVKKASTIKGWWDGDKDIGSEPHYKQVDYPTIKIYEDDYPRFRAYVEACNAEEDK